MVKVIAALEGNGTRPSHQGCGFNDGCVSFTLNHTEKHAVVYRLSNKWDGDYEAEKDNSDRQPSER